MTAPSAAPVRERVAAIIREGIGLDLPECDQVADAAIAELIAAMKEPSKEMMRAGHEEEAPMCPYCPPWNPSCGSVWRAMLSAFARSLRPEDGRRG